MSSGLLSLVLVYLSDNWWIFITILIQLYSEEKKASEKPKKKFLANDLKNMRELLSKNMYKIRQRVSFFLSFILYHLNKIA